MDSDARQGFLLAGRRCPSRQARECCVLTGLRAEIGPERSHFANEGDRVDPDPARRSSSWAHPSASQARTTRNSAHGPGGLTTRPNDRSATPPDPNTARSATPPPPHGAVSHPDGTRSIGSTRNIACQSPPACSRCSSYQACSPQPRRNRSPTEYDRGERRVGILVAPSDECQEPAGGAAFAKDLARNRRQSVPGRSRPGPPGPPPRRRRRDPPSQPSPVSRRRSARPPRPRPAHAPRRCRSCRREAQCGS
jgi:hypothetical protein